MLINYAKPKGNVVALQQLAKLTIATAKRRCFWWYYTPNMLINYAKPKGNVVALQQLAKLTITTAKRHCFWW